MTGPEKRCDPMKLQVPFVQLPVTFDAAALAEEVASIDDRPVASADFPVALDLQRRYFAAVRGTDPRYAHWLAAI